MEETELVLSTSGSGTFDVNGVMQFSIGPNDLSRWEIKQLSWSTTSSSVDSVDVYRGSVAASRLLDHTGATADISPTDIKLASGETLVIRATGGTPATVGTLVIEGSRYLKGKRIY